MMDSQKQMILNHLMKYGSITSLEAVEKYRIMRLSARIWDLRHDGYIIPQSREENNGKRYARYFWSPLNERSER